MTGTKTKKLTQFPLATKKIGMKAIVINETHVSCQVTGTHQHWDWHYRDQYWDTLGLPSSSILTCPSIAMDMAHSSSQIVHHLPPKYTSGTMLALVLPPYQLSIPKLNIPIPRTDQSISERLPQKSQFFSTSIQSSVTLSMDTSFSSSVICLSWLQLLVNTPFFLKVLYCTVSSLHLHMHAILRCLSEDIHL